MAILPDRATQRARLAEWRAQRRLRNALQKRFERELSKELRRVAEIAAEGFENGREQGIDIALRNHPSDMASILIVHWARTFEAFGKRLFDSQKFIQVPQRKDDANEFVARTQKWIRSIGADKVSRINKTTRKLIRDAIDFGVAEGEPISVIADRIVEKTGGKIAARRSIVIARTEVHQASQAADYEAADVIELRESQREWISVADVRTRGTHRKYDPETGRRGADGQKRGMNEPFDVGGDKLLYPGDPTGSPKEIIQCRCVTGIVVPR